MVRRTRECGRRVRTDTVAWRGLRVFPSPPWWCRLKESDASVWYFLGVNSLFQVGFGLLLVFSVFIHFPGTPSLSPAELPGYLWHATECFVGVQVRC